MAGPAPPAVDSPAAVETFQPLLARLNARGFRLLMPLDALVVASALVLPMMVRHGLGWPSYPWWAYAAGYAAIVALHLLALYFTGLYERTNRLGTRPVLPGAAAAGSGAILLVALAELLSGVYLVPRANLPVLLLLATLGVTGNRVLSRRAETRRVGPARVLVVGSPKEVTLARRHLRDASQPAEMVGATGTAANLLESVAAVGATDVLLLSTTALDDLYPHPLAELEEAGISVLQCITPRDTLLGLRAVGDVGGMPCVPLQTHALPRSRARAKRTLELVVLLLAAPVALPLLVLVAAYVRVVAGAPVLFRQPRVGKDAVIFDIVKFRTMRRDAEADGQVIIATTDDPRVLAGCRLLRASRIDELPQLVNVLRGQMSLIGPRPERPELVARYEKLIPGYHRRHEIPPGLTGLAQVQGRYHTDPGYKLGHDLQYLVNWSPVLDVQILCRTLWVVLTRRI